MANAVEQALLLPKDMAKLWSIKRHEVFLSLKRYLTMVCPLLSFFFFFFYFFIFLFLLLSSLSLFLIYVSFLGRLFKPYFGWRR